MEPIVERLAHGGSFLYFDNGNNLFGSLNGKDVVQFAKTRYSVLGWELEIGGIDVARLESFNTPVGPVQAYPFDESDVVMFQNPTLTVDGTTPFETPAETSGLTASAQVVPEQATFIRAMFGAVAIAGWLRIRRRAHVGS